MTCDRCERCESLKFSYISPSLHCSVLLESGSLLVFREGMYTRYLHGIEDGRFFDELDEPVQKTSDNEGQGEKEEQVCRCLNKHLLDFASLRVLDGGADKGDRLLVERGRRTSLTFRHVPPS